MPEQSDSIFGASRRQFLGAAAGSIASIGLFSGQISALSDDYSNVVDVVEAGADPNGEESASDVIRDALDDDTLLVFPEGEYLMDEQVRFTGFDHVGIQGENATIVPAPADQFSGESRLFKFGTDYAPGNDLSIDGLTFDFTADNTGLRALQCQIADGLRVTNVEVVGEHDSGTWGPFLFDVVDPDGTGTVQNVSAPDGGAFSENTAGDATPTVKTGPTGLIISPHHAGELVLENVTLGGFPDNGLYSSSPDGTVSIRGGRFENSNVANIRLAGNGTVENAVIAVTENRGGIAQPGIRLDEGDQFKVSRTTIELSEPHGSAIRVTSSASEAVLDRVEIVVGSNDSPNDAIHVSGGAGPTYITNSTIELNCPGQALMLVEGDGAPVRVENVRVTGDGSSHIGGRHAVRCDRAGSELIDVEVSQPGSGLRRALAIGADDVTVSGGRYNSTHYPIVNDASGTRLESLTAWADGDVEAIKLIGGHSDVEIVDSTLYGGINDQGTENLTTDGNDTPSGSPDETFTDDGPDAGADSDGSDGGDDGSDGGDDGSDGGDDGSDGGDDGSDGGDDGSDGGDDGSDGGDDGSDGGDDGSDGGDDGTDGGDDGSDGGDDGSDGGDDGGDDGSDGGSDGGDDGSDGGSGDDGSDSGGDDAGSGGSSDDGTTTTDPSDGGGSGSGDESSDEVC